MSHVLICYSFLELLLRLGIGFQETLDELPTSKLAIQVLYTVSTELTVPFVPFGEVILSKSTQNYHYSRFMRGSFSYSHRRHTND